MRTTNQKAIDYLNGNPIVANFINKLNIQRKDHYVKADMVSQYKELIVEARKQGATPVGTDLSCCRWQTDGQGRLGCD